LKFENKYSLPPFGHSLFNGQK